MSSVVSVIIPTKYRPEEVGLTVRTVLEQSDPPGQIVIVDQSEGDEIRKSVERQYGDAPSRTRQRVNLTYVHDPAISGAPEARNRGMDAARGDIILFLDDDVRLETDFVGRILQVYREHPQATGVSGVFTNYARPAWASRCWSRIFARGRFRDERQPVYWDADKLRDAEPIRVTKFTGALMSFRASEIRHVRFDEHVRGTSAEDFDFCLHQKPGAILLMTPKARLEHKRSGAGRCKEHWIYSDAERASYIFWKHWRGDPGACLLFAWLLAGYATAALLHTVRRGPRRAWDSLLRGVKDGRAEALAALAADTADAGRRQ